ncbi:MAG: carboxylating nicotinate-nucleotide diphosphorylase [Candidatus Omnitrophica bacterium]|nr:carboxylating nicotinate-nucleotide diphosphorylase [Candidatus Omnitrophota bacterium]
MVVRRVKEIIQRALEEDIGKEDITTLYTIPSFLRVKAKLIAKEGLILCGIDIFRQVFKALDRNIKFKSLKKDGSKVKKGEVLAVLEGKASAILKGERTALNFLSHLSGIASETHRFLNKVKKYKVKILDTRKTIPGLRSLEKYAVRVGGGLNHRQGLWDGIIIKENHLLSLGIKGRNKFDFLKLAGLIKNIKKAVGKKVEVEVENLREFKYVCECRPDIILLDNFSPQQVKRAVLFRNEYFPEIKLEVSGGIDESNIIKFARFQVDFISLGVLTHSSPAKDISLEVIAFR